MEVAPNLPWVVVDPHRFQQILLNLIANAIKFTPEGGDIAVLAERQDDRLLVKVRDTGAGISPTQKRWIFEAFASDSETTNGESSLGLGLTIARALTELHHGYIQVESEEEAPLPSVSPYSGMRCWNHLRGSSDCGPGATAAVGREAE